jgi:hypothetical protein
VNAPHADESVAGTVRHIVQTETGAEERDATTDERSRLMTEFSILHDGRHYHYDGYCYDHLADAVGYARLVHAQRSRTPPDTVPFTRLVAVEPPSMSEREIMTALSISFEKGVYVFDGFHYEHLADAVNYARRCRERRASTESAPCER